MFGILTGLVAGVVFGLAIGLATVLATVLVLGLKPREVGRTTNVGPGTLFRSDRTTFTVVTLVTGLLCGLAVGLMSEPKWGLVAGLVPGLLTFHLQLSTWPHFAITRIYLALSRRAPLALMSFLKDAHEHRGVLRQVGPVYEFRHIDLQRHLAKQHRKPPTPREEQHA
jgi:hypothetical protein